MPAAKKQATPKLMTRGERVCAFIEAFIIVPDGEHMGKKLKLEPWQRDWILAIYDNPAGTRTGILSIGRKNGKTALIACILLAHLIGPEAVQNSQIVSGAMSLDQAAIVFHLATLMIKMNPELDKRIKIFPSGKRLLGVARNVTYKALSADAKTKHGLSPILVIMDELGQVKGPTNEFVNVVKTAQGAHKTPLYLVISTQAPTDNDLLSRMIDAHRDKPNPRTVCHVYEAPADCALNDREAWKAANPALGVFRSLQDMEDLVQDAMDIPTNEPALRNLYLNQRIEAESPFVSRSTWEANGAAPGDATGLKVWAGLDLSSVNDLTALVAVDEKGGVHPTFWLPDHGLKAKGEKDSVPYEYWRDQGYLKTTPGKAIEYRFVAQYLRVFFDKYDVQAIGFDRYNMKFLLPWLDEAGFSPQEIDKFVEFGQGTASMTPALRDLEVKLLNGQLKHGNHYVLNWCSHNAKVVGDSGARKFDKKTARGRIDGMVALAMAVGVMPQETQEQKRTWDDYLADMAGA
jgi:phage terminase large subunit-like protein